MYWISNGRRRSSNRDYSTYFILRRLLQLPLVCGYPIHLLRTPNYLLHGSILESTIERKARIWLGVRSRSNTRCNLLSLGMSKC
jgi:hypothetical protein